MKKLGTILLLLFIIITFSCDFNSEWDGKTLDGEQYYILNAEQVGTILRVVVTVDNTEYTKAHTKEGFKAPEELFLWMSPKYKNEQGDSNYKSIYPAARQRIKPGDLFDIDGNAILGSSINIDIDLATMARDWNIDWLSEYNFDGDPEDQGWANEDGDDMNGCYLFMSDGYSKYDQGYEDSDDGYNDGYYIADSSKAVSYRMFADSQLNFDFNRSRPSGSGYSNVKEYPDTSKESWVAFTLLGEGMYVSTQDVLGGEVVRITLQINPDQSFSGSVAMNGQRGDNYDLNEANSNHTDSTPHTIIWDVVFHAPPYTPTIIDNEWHIEAQKNQYFDLSWNQGWQSNSFNYMGEPVVYLSTDFDGNNFGLSGSIGKEATDLNPTTEYLDWPLYDTPDNSFNNWTITTAGEGYQPTKWSTGNVLGLSSQEGGNSVEDLYGQNRNDIITFPEFEYSGENELVVAFDMYREFDWNWYDCIYIEYWDGFGWQGAGNIGGAMEYWEKEENNGWQLFTAQFLPQGESQKIRFRFHSNDWEENLGILIDNVKILSLQ